MTEPTPIEYLARKAAVSGLCLRDARSLFDALYVADALAIEGGSLSRAAQRAEMSRKHLCRIRGRTETEDKDA